MPVNFHALNRAFDIEGYLKQIDPNAKRYDANIAIRDPHCGKEGKLWVLVTDKSNGTKAGAWICYYCNESGMTPLDLVRRVEDCNLFKAIEIMTQHQLGNKPLADLRELVLQTLDGVSETEEWDDKPMVPVSLPREFVRNSRKLPAYFKKRGITLKRSERHNLGWCDTGYFANRLIVPVYDHKNEQMFFVARYMKAKPPKGVKKTIYPKGCHPNRVLFNYRRAKKQDRIIIVEDVFSAMAVGKEAVASFGTSFSQYQLDLLLKTSATEIVIIWDLDAGAKKGQSGYEKAQKLAMRLSEFWTVRVVKLPDERDPDEIPRDELNELIEASEVLDQRAAFKSYVLSRLAP